MKSQNIDEVERKAALEAGRLMANPAMQMALAEMDASFVRAWRNGKTTEEREKAWMLQLLLEMLRRQMLAPLQRAVLKTRGKDIELNAALKAAKEKSE